MSLTPTRWLTVYCASRSGVSPVFAEQTRVLAEAMASRGIGLVYGGSRSGLMGILANTLLEAGGEVHGIMPRLLFSKEVNHDSLTHFEEVDDMTARKRRMLEQGDAILALPGGIGTLEELFEVWSWRQLGLHEKPIGLLNVDGYYDSLLEFINTSLNAGLMNEQAAGRCWVDTSAEHLLDRLLPQ
ncbi:TIGR00730 family Rossman fold protein [Pokkaliibacter sp. CJK22405]|uniref:LOG family protein n=1 Tax=Pokkaliibacter sp. CJK22405 TaxID=3384615 RepID=UPI00398466A8